MLDCDRDVSLLVQAIDSLPCEIELPESWQDFFAQKGQLPTYPCERRRFPRFCLRTSAAMRLLQNIPELNRSGDWYKVLVKDVSRSGFSFLHSEQLFPLERLELVIDESHHYFGVVRQCRKVGPNCYIIGARYCDE